MRKLHVIASGSEKGSAYIVALLLLLLLTVIGLSLSLVTQNELQIGANEKMINRVFYAADSAIIESTARFLINDETEAASFFTSDLGSPTAANLGISVQRQGFCRVNNFHCGLCEVNQVSGQPQFQAVTYFVDVTASRTGTNGGTLVPMAEKRLTAMMDIQPYSPRLESCETAP